MFRLVGIRASVREMAPSLFLGAAVPTVCALASLAFLGSERAGRHRVRGATGAGCTAAQCCSASAKHSVLSVSCPPAARSLKPSASSTFSRYLVSVSLPLGCSSWITPLIPPQLPLAARYVVFPTPPADSAVGCGFSLWRVPRLRPRPTAITLLKASLVVYPLVIDPAGTGSANPREGGCATESRVASSREVAQNRGKVS